MVTFCPLSNKIRDVAYPFTAKEMRLVINGITQSKRKLIFCVIS